MYNASLVHYWRAKTARIKSSQQRQGAATTPIIVNIMASGEKFRSDFFDPDVATGHHNVRGLLQAMMTFAIGNELMLEGLFVVQPYHTQQRTY